jgi:rhodanese-related sulfurtransferase
MKKKLIVTGLLLFAAALAGAQEIFEISPQSAFERLRQPNTYLIDVRTIAEYVYVGHPEMATCIPLMFWDETQIQQVANVNFLEDVKARFKPTDTLILICRSGSRSRHAMRLLRREGFSSVFNISEGFEGNRDREGYRTLGGWKNHGLPYTYVLDPELIYSYPER